jgi:hypothetical protein
MFFFPNPAVSKLFAISFVKEWRNSISGRWKHRSTKCDVTIQFLVGSLVIHFAGIFHLSGSVQKLFKNFMLVQWLKVLQFFGENMTPKIFLQFSRPSKGTSLRKSASIEALWSSWLLPFEL